MRSVREWYFACGLVKFLGLDSVEAFFSSNSAEKHSVEM